MRMPTTVYHPYVPSGSTNIKTKNFTFFQALRQTLAESEGLSASCLKPCDFNGFEPADFAVCTSYVYQCRAFYRVEFESLAEFEPGSVAPGPRVAVLEANLRAELRDSGHARRSRARP
jgi:hypothetical protein